MSKENKARPCSWCGTDLNICGEDSPGMCGDCTECMRVDAVVYDGLTNDN